MLIKDYEKRKLMKFHIVAAVFVSSACTVEAFLNWKHIQQSTWPNLYWHSCKDHSPRKNARGDRILILSQRKTYGLDENESKKKSCQDPCKKINTNLHESEEDIDQDRREAFFAMIGSLWAIAGGGMRGLFPEPAYAEYGAEANIFIPNPYDALNDRATKNCLVESLGTRQCLIYADEANFLYKGADDGVLIERIEKASKSFGTIPALVFNKKWSQVTGVLTGPMGELIRNMSQLAAMSRNQEQSKNLIKVLKNDLYAMSDGVSRKDQDIVLKNHEKATNDLVAFLKSL